MANTIDGLIDHLMGRRRDCRMRRDKLAETMAMIGGSMGGGGGGLEGLGLVGTGLKVGSQISGGMAAKEAADFEAKQLTQRAGEARAAAQRAAMEKDADTAKVIGKQRAVAAASGTAIASPTTIALIGETAQRGQYLADIERYKGKAKAKELLDTATATKQKGKNALVASLLEGVGTGVSGIAKYGPRRGKSDEDGILGEDVFDDELDLNTHTRTKTTRYRFG